LSCTPLLMTSESSFELTSHDRSASEGDESRHSHGRPLDANASSERGEINGQALEPADGGPSAWKILVSAFAFEAVLWGKHARKISAI
jgi:hypothetical protein